MCDCLNGLSALMASIKKYLQRLQKAPHFLSGCGFTGWVLGNPSADLDSVVSSLVLSFLLSEVSDGTRVYIPVINTPESEFCLRYQVIEFLRSVFELSTSEEVCALFVYRDSPGTSFLFGPTAPAALPDVTLVDHNVAQGYSVYPSWFYSTVSRVVDHHGASEPTPQHLKQTIAEWDGGPLLCVATPYVGSCASLVTLLLFNSVAGKRLQQTQRLGLDTRRLLAGTIVQDTFGLDEAWKGKRWCDVDAEAFGLLSTCSSPVITLGELCTSIDELRASSLSKLFQLDCDKLLICDAKFYKYTSSVCAHYSSFPVSLKALLSSLQSRGIRLVKSLEKFAADQSATILVLMSLFGCKEKEANELERELGFFFPSSSSQDFEERFLRRLRDIDDLQLEPLAFELTPRSDAPPRLHLFRQGNTRYSRKVLEPFLRQILAQDSPLECKNA